jgi:urease accessory protein
VATVNGHLSLRFDYDSNLGRTVMRAGRQDSPFKVIRAFPLADGAALVHLHNVSGGLLGGDRMILEVEVGPGAAAQLTTTGATRLYRSRGDKLCTMQRTNVRVEKTGLLEYVPDLLIPFAGSRYSQETTVELADGAGLFWWEVIAPGREASGETLAYDLFQSRFDLSAGGKPLASERIRLVPREQDLSSPSRLGSYRYFAGFYICKVGAAPSEWDCLESELGDLAGCLSRRGEILWGVSRLTAHGLLVRALSLNGRDIAAGLPQFWRIAKQKLYGREYIPPRKIY